MSKIYYNIYLDKCNKECKVKENALIECLNKNNNKIKFCYIKRYEYEKCLMKYVDKEENL